MCKHVLLKLFQRWNPGSWPASGPLSNFGVNTNIVCTNLLLGNCARRLLTHQALAGLLRPQIGHARSYGHNKVCQMLGG